MSEPNPPTPPQSQSAPSSPLPPPEQRHVLANRRHRRQRTTKFLDVVSAVAALIGAVATPLVVYTLQYSERAREQQNFLGYVETSRARVFDFEREHSFVGCAYDSLNMDQCVSDAKQSLAAIKLDQYADLLRFYVSSVEEYEARYCGAQPQIERWFFPSLKDCGREDRTSIGKAAGAIAAIDSHND
jgi:hypothetical protein